MSTASSNLSFTGGGRVRALEVRRLAGARRMRLVVDPRDGAVRLTLPRRAPLGDAIAWVESKRRWIETTLSALPAVRPLVDGATVPFEGIERQIEWQADRTRVVRMEARRLIVGGPAEMVAMRLLRWLRAEALARLDAETREFAAAAGVAVGRVGIGDPRSRWGSCSSCGDIRYSWRLILAPPNVRRATVAHEVAHRLHMDHSPAFHAAVARLLGYAPTAERAWLREHGAQLHAVARE